MYRIYRYLNLIHALLYKPHSTVLKHMTLDDFVDQLGLLTPYEAKSISVMDDTHRDAAISLLGAELSDFLESEEVNHRFDREIYSYLSMLRGRCATLYVCFQWNCPNHYVDMMKGLVGVLSILVVVGYPFTMLVKHPKSMYLSCAQPMVLFCTVFTLMSIQLPFVIFYILRDPFVSNRTHGKITVENILASSERIIFANMRTPFGFSYEQCRRESHNKEIERSSIFKLKLPDIEDELDSEDEATNGDNPRRKTFTPRELMIYSLGSNKRGFVGTDAEWGH